MLVAEQLQVDFIPVIILGGVGAGRSDTPATRSCKATIKARRGSRAREPGKAMGKHDLWKVGDHAWLASTGL